MFIREIRFRVAAFGVRGYLLALIVCLPMFSRAASGQRLGQKTVDSPWQMQDIAKVPQAGEVVSQADYQPSQWYKATVPGTVLTTLVDNGVYPDPLYGENDRPNIIPDSLCRTSYWYRAQVAVPAEFEGKHIWLNFEGINYIADVWVNGHNLGTIKGAFTRGTFDISQWAKAGQTATVAVLIHPPPHPNTPNEHTIAAGVGRNGGIMSKDGPTFVASQGWNWISGVRDRDMGIWQKVTLSATGPVVIENPYVTSEIPLPKTDSADLTVAVTLHNVSDSPQSGMLGGILALGNDPIGSIDHLLPEFNLPAITLQPNESRTVKLTSSNVSALHVVNPRLWWPNGYGAPNLNTLRLQFTGANIGSNRGFSDSHDITFGIRKITYKLPDSDNLAIIVNGVPVMCRGGNWGLDEAMKRIPRERLEAQVHLHQLANFNMIRNWVGQSTGEDFYDLCDRYGLMVWDEFFEPNPSDSGRQGAADRQDVFDVPMYLDNVREKVLRFRNHPSIALWCGRNEGDPAPADLADGLLKMMPELDPQRLYHPNSANGKGVHSGGPYRWRPPGEYYVFPDSGPGVEAFKTELGLGVSMPTLEAVHAMIPRKDWETINDDWAIHNFTRGTQGGERFATPGMDLMPRYGKWNNLPDFIRRAQAANYEAARAMFEGRQAKMFKPVTGVLDWMSNPAIYSFTYQLYSHDLEPDASLFGAMHGCEQIHIQMNQNAANHFMVINQTAAALAGYSAEARVFNLDGTPKYQHAWKVDAPASAATDLGAIDWPADLSQVHFVKVRLADAGGKTVSQNFYWRENPAGAGDFTSMVTMPAVTLEGETARHDADEKCLLDVKLSNPAPQNVALLAHLQLRRARTNERVLPVYYSDNYISLLGGESRTITIQAALKDLAGDDPLVMLDGFNVTVKPRSGGANGSIAPNSDALNYTTPTATPPG